MKSIPYLLIFFLFSCDNNQLNNDFNLIDNNADSIIIKSNKSILVSDTLNKISDSITTTKVNKVIKEIHYLTKYVNVLKIEKNNLTKELKYSKENVRIDTVFVETKKSFWGKTKTTINTKTDTSSNQAIDSIVIRSVDTIK
jgi:hypothetical protein